VHISAAMHRLADLGHDTFLEISPHPSMDDAADSEYTLVSSLRSGESERESMLASLGRLYSSGQSIAWELLHPWGGRPAAAPTYPWQRERFWLDDLDDTDATPSQPRTDVDGPAIDDTLGEEALKVRLDRADQPERQRLLRSYLQSQTAGRLGMPPSLLDIQSPLTTFGVDSLMAAELRKQIEHDLGIVVPAVEFLDGPSVAALADWLGSTLSSGAPWKPKTTVPADLLVTAPNGGHEASALAGERWIDLLTQVPHVSDDDVDALLREVLQAEGDSDDWNSRSGS